MCSLTLDCLPDSEGLEEACFDVTLSCPIESGSVCNANCESHRSCVALYIFAVDEYQGLNLANGEASDNIIYSCGFGEEQSDCDLLSVQSPVICNHSDCVIDCAQTECDARVINGTAATSLDISCEGSTCDASTIYCPETQNASCSIRCVEGTCLHSNIVWSANAEMHTFDLHCGQFEGCSAVSITLSVPSLNSLSIRCLDFRACQGMDVSVSIDSLKSFNVSCFGYYSCYFISLHPTTSDTFAGVDTLSLHCSGVVCIRVHFSF